MKPFLLFGTLVLTISQSIFAQSFGRHLIMPISVHDVTVVHQNGRVKSIFVPSHAISSLATTHQGFRVKPKCVGEDRGRDCLIPAEPTIGGFELSGLILAIFTYMDGRLYYGSDREVESFIVVESSPITFAPDQ